MPGVKFSGETLFARSVKYKGVTRLIFYEKIARVIIVFNLSTLLLFPGHSDKCGEVDAVLASSGLCNWSENAGDDHEKSSSFVESPAASGAQTQSPPSQ